MKHARLELARSAELLPDLGGPVGVFGAIDADRLRGLEDIDLQCISNSYEAGTALRARGFRVDRELHAPITGAIVLLPRAKAEALHLIAQAVAAAPKGWIVVDGQKTDGIESIAKQIAKAVPLAGTYSKSHGKTIWFEASQAPGFETWLAQPARIEGEYLTAPGVFSADGIDPASAMLLEHLPRDVSGSVVDLGAGWGYLSAEYLKRAPSLSSVHLVEDNAAALECARENVKDARAQFHWGDALTWRPPEPVQTIIMNPPFHKSRNAEPSLGIAFIDAAARLLKPGGRLFMVANAHLPYEAALEKNFTNVDLLARSTRFKVFSAERSRAKTR